MKDWPTGKVQGGLGSPWTSRGSHETVLIVLLCFSLSQAYNEPCLPPHARFCFQPSAVETSLPLWRAGAYWDLNQIWSYTEPHAKWLDSLVVSFYLPTIQVPTPAGILIYLLSQSLPRQISLGFLLSLFLSFQLIKLMLPHIIKACK